jgi:hypothetical protein
MSKTPKMQRDNADDQFSDAETMRRMELALRKSLKPRLQKNAPKHKRRIADTAEKPLK